MSTLSIRGVTQSVQSLQQQQLAEATETPEQTLKEALAGDPQAIKKLAAQKTPKHHRHRQTAKPAAESNEQPATATPEGKGTQVNTTA